LFCEDFGFCKSCGDSLIQRPIPQLAPSKDTI
jgi:hypothetical protein